ncbi:MAG: hypothetical protein P0S93_06690 [Candidatus Neptunochlamydia sp.]|nr:hypothetical protein [Candidatus Neptunochlamydia sp.]
MKRLSYETVQTLCDQGIEAIENNTPDRAIEILVALDQGQCQGDVKPLQNLGSSKLYGVEIL